VAATVVVVRGLGAVVTRARGKANVRLGARLAVVGDDERNALFERAAELIDEAQAQAQIKWTAMTPVSLPDPDTAR
jgi:hypothetical protein